jgi:hypothetical protein
VSVTGGNGEDLLRKDTQPVQVGDREELGNRGRDGEGSGGRGGTTQPDPPASSQSVTAGAPDPGTIVPALDSEASAFPEVVGNRPVDLVPRYPQPVALPGERDLDDVSQPPVITPAWIRGQVDPELWQRHWKHGGRITPAMIHEYYQGLCQGYSQTGVRRRLGISDSTWTEWRKAAERGSEIHVLFRRVVESGLGNIEGKAVDAWVSKVPDDWRAAQEFLKTRFPQEWNPNVQVEVTHTGGVEVDHKLSLDDDDILRVADILRTSGVLDAGSDTQQGIVDAEVVDD